MTLLLTLHDSDAVTLMEELCYVPFGIKELTVTPSGGTFSLGNSDASLEIPPGAVMTNTPIRYAIILHGPFVLQPGYRRVSVVIYLNLNRATLLQPIFLNLADWCERRYSTQQYELTFFRASHEIKAEGENREYHFCPLPNSDHQSEDVLKIIEPKSHYAKVLKEGRHGIHDLYCAMPIQKRDPRANNLQIRILFTWKSQSWIMVSPALNFLIFYDIVCNIIICLRHFVGLFPCMHSGAQGLLYCEGELENAPSN